MTRHARRPADNLRLMVMAAAMNPNDGAQDTEDDDRLMIILIRSEDVTFSSHSLLSVLSNSSAAVQAAL